MHWRIEGGKLQPVTTLPTALLFGVSVYTSFRWPLSSRWLSAHHQRLIHDASALGIACPIPLVELEQALGSVEPGQTIRLTVVPQVAHFPELFKDRPQAGQVYLSTRPLPEVPTQPLRLKTMMYDSPLAGIKHGSMATSVYLKRQAQSEDFDDTLWTDATGRIREASTANVFFIQGQTLLTPDPQQTPCLPGITRQQLLELAQHLKLEYREGTISLETLSAMDGAFLTNAVQGIREVSAINQTGFSWPDPAKTLLEQLRQGLKTMP